MQSLSPERHFDASVRPPHVFACVCVHPLSGRVCVCVCLCVCAKPDAKRPLSQRACALSQTLSVR